MNKRNYEIQTNKLRQEKKEKNMNLTNALLRQSPGTQMAGKTFQ